MHTKTITYILHKHWPLAYFINTLFIISISLKSYLVSNILTILNSENRFNHLNHSENILALNTGLTGYSVKRGPDKLVKWWHKQARSPYWSKSHRIRLNVTEKYVGKNKKIIKRLEYPSWLHNNEIHFLELFKYVITTFGILSGGGASFHMLSHLLGLSQRFF